MPVTVFAVTVLGHHFDAMVLDRARAVTETTGVEQRPSNQACYIGM